MVPNRDERLTGIIRAYYPLRGYGFIRRASGRDVFFYRTSVTSEADLVEGAVVTFRLEAGDKGPRAVELVRDT
jgi:CspA family cold shock protein